MKFNLLLLIISSLGLFAQNIDYRTQLKNKPVITVTDAPYNADPTGSKDSTAALNSAITAAQLVNGEVKFPCGTFVTSTGLHNTKRITYTGGGSGEGPDVAAACTTLKVTGDVTGIFVDGASDTVISGISLLSTATGGTGNGITIGTSGGSSASNVKLENLVISNFKGSGIYIGQGNTTKIDGVVTLLNDVDGLTVDDPSGLNANATNVIWLKSVSNGRDGMHFDHSIANKVTWCDCEGNTRYNLYTNRPYQQISMYSEGAISGVNEYIDASTFDSVMTIRDVQFSIASPTSIHVGNTSNQIAILNGQGQNPYLNPTTGRWQVNGPLGIKCIAVTYSTSMVLDTEKGNCFSITITDNVNFAVSVANKFYSQLVIVLFKNSSGATLTSTVTFTGISIGRSFSLPANGKTRAISLLTNTLDSTTTEFSRTAQDIGSGSILTDFVTMNTNNYHNAAISPPLGATGISFINVPFDAWYSTSCSAHNSATSSTSATITFKIHPYPATTLTETASNFDMNDAAAFVTLNAVSYVPANTSGAGVDFQVLLPSGTNTGGTVQVDCSSIITQFKK